MAPFIFWETINLHNYTDSTEKLTDLAKEQYDAYFIPPLGWEEREV